MSKTIDINKLAKALAEVLATAFAAHATSVPEDENDDETEDAAPAKRGRGRPAGTTKAAGAKGKTKPKPAPADDDDDDDGLGDDDAEEEDDGLGDDDEEVTQEEVVAAFKALKASKGVDKCREVLAKIGESNALNIPPKKYADTLKEIRRAGGKK